MGVLELPMPDLSKGRGSLEAQGKELEKRIKAGLPRDLRDSIRVKTFGSGERSGLRIEFDDRAEQMVLVAIEYPPGSDREECVAPPRRPKKRSC